VTMVEAVRQALSALGDVSNEELAAYIKTTFGITVRPNFMPVMRAAVKDKANLELWRRRPLSPINPSAAASPAP
jgi:hypothetical protein